MCRKESWGANVVPKDAHSTQRGQPPRMHGPGLWRYKQKEERVTPVPLRLVGWGNSVSDPKSQKLWTTRSQSQFLLATSTHLDSSPNPTTLQSFPTCVPCGRSVLWLNFGCPNFHMTIISPNNNNNNVLPHTEKWM